MSSLNEAHIIGRVGLDPVIKTFESGHRVANLSIGTQEKWTDKHTGEEKKHTDWHRISVHNKNIVDVIDKYVDKGDLIMVKGKIKTRKYQDNTGQDRHITEIILGPWDSRLILLTSRKSKEEAAAEEADDAPQGTTASVASQKPEPKVEYETNADIPF